MVVNVPTKHHNTGRWLLTAISFVGRTPRSPGRNHMTSPNTPADRPRSTHPHLRQLADTGLPEGSLRAVMTSLHEHGFIAAVDAAALQHPPDHLSHLWIRLVAR
jgi:hypothetical protein